MTALPETQTAIHSRTPDGLWPGATVITTPVVRTPTLGARTKAVRAGIATDSQYGAVVPPLHLSSTFSFASFGQSREFDYTRSGNPTRAILARALAELEEGAAAIVTSTGMSAITLVLHLLKPEDRILCSHDCYGGTHRLLQALSARGQFRCEFVDLTAPHAAQIVAAAACKLVWIETPSNPLLRITDIRAICDAAHRAGALAVVDNTFLSPALQRPITLGADIVVHSTTKYLNGHSDVVGGAVVAADGAVAEKLSWWANCLGLTGAPFDSYLTLRGVRTLHPRMLLHEENAHQIVNVLASHSAVSRVNYPGLASHAGHELATRQQSGFGAMISFELRGGRGSAEVLVDALQCFTLAESLGGVESLIAHPATMTHASMDEAARQAAGITDALFRLSVGIEDGDDLTRDLAQALDRAAEINEFA